jgi:hypothetical protein
MPLAACRVPGVPAARGADLREIDIHPNASIGTVVRAMSCKRCSPHPPFARPLGATRRSWEGREWRLKRATEPVRYVQAEDIGWGQRQVQAVKKRKPR